MLDTLNQIHLEQWPSELIGTAPVSKDWSRKDWLNYIFNMYVRYIDISKRVEDCYDQTVYPQMRNIIEKFLKNILCRIVQLKKEFLAFNNPFQQKGALIYVYLDNYLIDFKLEPENINLVIPRYFRENNSDNALLRRKILETRLKEFNLDVDPEEHFPKKNFFKKEISVEDAIRAIQTFELGRQNMRRINQLISNKKVENEFVIGEDKKFMDDERKKIA